MCILSFILIFHHKLNFAKNVTYDLLAFSQRISFSFIGNITIIYVVSIFLAFGIFAQHKKKLRYGNYTNWHPEISKYP